MYGVNFMIEFIKRLELTGFLHSSQVVEEAFRVEFVSTSRITERRHLGE